MAVDVDAADGRLTPSIIDTSDVESDGANSLVGVVGEQPGSDRRGARVRAACVTVGRRGQLSRGKSLTALPRSIFAKSSVPRAGKLV